MPRKSNRRETIIEVATARFLISGYDVVTVDEICALTSSTKGSFYHFFENKESLAVDVVNDVWYATEREMEEIFSSQMSPEKKLKLEVERIAAHYVRFEGKRYFIGCPIGTLAVSLRGKSQKLTRRLNFALNHMRQFYTDAYADMYSQDMNREDTIGQDMKSQHMKSTDKSPQKKPAVLADSLMIRIQGLSALGKVTSSPRVKEFSRQIIASLS